MCEGLSYQIINTSAVNQDVFVTIRSLQKSLQKRKHQSWRYQPRQRYTFLNPFKIDLAKRIYTNLGVYEFLNIHIFNWCKARYSASSSTF